MTDTQIVALVATFAGFVLFVIGMWRDAPFAMGAGTFVMIVAVFIAGIT